MERKIRIIGNTALAAVPKAVRAAGQTVVGAAAMIAAFATTVDAARAEGPVVVELFTSQGCSSCPPADDFLGELAGRKDVIALALHVDYWDYLGWRDTFALPGNTDRQKAYRAELNNRSIYTPQAMIDGVADVVGSRQAELLRTISKAREVPNLAAVSFDDIDGRMIARVAPSDPDTRPKNAATVWMATYAPVQSVVIQRGENAGRTQKYHNVVMSWVNMGEWRGGEAEYDAPMPEGAGGAAVLVQVGRGGPILGAAEYRR